MRSLVCGIAALAMAGLQGAPVRAQTPLPAVEFRLGCLDDGAEQTAAEIEGLLALHEFARAHDAEVVWLDAVIVADAGSGACSRDVSAFPDQPGPTGERARIVIQPCVDRPRAEACGDAAGVIRVTANGPPLAYAHAVQLPDTDSLGDDLPYRHGGYGDWLNYQGPFIVRYFEGTGYAFVTFHTPHPALPGVWDRARCNARPDACAP
ncbi:MAG: hypothetical protein Q8O54_04545 [Brevundimonas sp.]|nr:hypothetical protein [Brevundimonas sp.]